MIDRHKMIIWSQPKKEKISEQVDKVYNILCLLREYCGLLFLPAVKKNKVNEFDIKKDNIEHLILSKQDKMFPNLGSELSFFTSLEKEKSMNIHFSVGRYDNDSDFINTMTISLPTDFTETSIIESIEMLECLIKYYSAFYACITSNFNLEMYDYDKWFDFENIVPKVVFWVNYWGKDILEKVWNLNKITENSYENKKIYDGVYIRLQKKPIDIFNTEHIYLQKKLNDMLVM